MVSITEFRGHRVLCLKRTEDDEHPFQFGLGKAKLILAHLDDIRDFVTANDKE